MAFCLKNKRGLTGAPRGVDNVGGGGGLFFSVMALTLVLLPSGFFTHDATSPVAGADIGIGIGIGIGGGSSSPPSPEQQHCNCPPSPPPPPPLPPPPPPPGYENEKQYEAAKVIRQFGRTITCDPLGITKTWRGPKVCDYKGFRCDTPPKTKDRTIAAVDFNGYNLAAPTICGFADRLPDIALFHANSNNFSDTVPDLSHLRYLYELDLSNNKLTGPFPTTVLLLRQAVFLDIRYNSFSGSVPPGVFALDVDVLFLNNNMLEQPLPKELGNTNASYITLANNRFTGPIPTSIGGTAARFITEVLFLNNRLSGCLPYQVGLLRNATVFDAGNNRITGTIPLALGCLAKVEQLNLANNCLYGEVPDEVCRLPRLLNLSLSGNYFTGLGKACLPLLHRGVLNVRNNCIPWLPMQKPRATCAAFAAEPKYCHPITYIPCKLPYEDDERRALPTPEPSRAYAALHRNGGT